MNYLIAAWGTIIGLALMLVGGLVLWAYGGSRATALALLVESGPEAEATRLFHQRLARWFFIYGSVIVTLGLALLLWASATIFQG